MKRDLLELIWSRANKRCEYCRFFSELAWLPFQVDRIIAEKHSGSTIAENLALSCFYCNSFKGPNIAGIDPEGAPDVAVQLFHPRRDEWAAHFHWNGPYLTGITPTGRATVAVLRINEPDVVELRRLLLDLGYPL